MARGKTSIIISGEKASVAAYQRQHKRIGTAAASSSKALSAVPLRSENQKRSKA